MSLTPSLKTDRHSTVIVALFLSKSILNVHFKSLFVVLVFKYVCI